MSKIPSKIPQVRKEMQDLIYNLRSGLADVDDAVEWLEEWIPRLMRAPPVKPVSMKRHSSKLTTVQKMQIDALRAKGMPQQKVAEIVGTNAGRVSEYEHGLR